MTVMGTRSAILLGLGEPAGEGSGAGTGVVDKPIPRSFCARLVRLNGRPGCCRRVAQLWGRVAGRWRALAGGAAELGTGCWSGWLQHTGQPLTYLYLLTLLGDSLMRRSNKNEPDKA